MVFLRSSSKCLLLVMLVCTLCAAGWAVQFGFSPVRGSLTSGFGWRSDPMNGQARFHAGIDIAAKAGSPVYAPQAGRVMYSGPYGGYGNVVVLQHGPSLFTLYGHNAYTLVTYGETVSPGQVIAVVGSTGRSTGPHLHFEVHHQNAYVNPLDYLAYLSGGNRFSPGNVLIQSPLNPGQAAVTNTVVSATVASGSEVPRLKTANNRGNTNQVELIKGTRVQLIEF